MAGITILVVEDEAMTALFMEKMLKKMGYNVLKRVPSGEEGVDYAVRFKPDLVILDIRLAGYLNGIETAAKIKREAAKAIQFIFTTGYSDFQLREDAMKTEPLGFFSKPVNMKELVNVIERFFESPRTPGGGKD
jgi:two-component SAPR family response regulator